MNFTDYLVLFSAVLIILTEIRDTYRRWRNYEPEEMLFLRREMVRNGADAERLRIDREKWVKELSSKYLENEDLKKKIEHLRKQIPPAKLLEIDDSFHGEHL